jgi:hypothetical protein
MWNAIADFLVNKRLGYQSANNIKNNIVAVASARLRSSLGGSREIGILAAVASDAVNYVDVELDGSQLAGFTIRARVQVRTLNATTTVTPKVRNITDGSDAGVGVACSATNADYSGSNQKQTIALTIPAAVKTYRLQLTPSDALNAVFGEGHIEIFATA